MPRRPHGWTHIMHDYGWQDCGTTYSVCDPLTYKLHQNARAYGGLISVVALSWSWACRCTGVAFMSITLGDCTLHQSAFLPPKLTARMDPGSHSWIGSTPKESRSESTLCTVCRSSLQRSGGRFWARITRLLTSWLTSQAALVLRSSQTRAPTHFQL